MLRDITLAGGRKLGVFVLKKLHRLLFVICWVLFFTLFLMNFVLSALPSIRIQGRSVKNSPQVQDDVKYFHVSGEQNWNDSRPFLSLLNYSVHLYSATAYNSTDDSFYDVIHLSGWENRPWAIEQTPHYTCCLLYSNDGSHSVIGTRLRARHDWSYVGKAKLEVKQFLCGNVLNARGLSPTAVSLGIDRKCPKHYSQYIKVDYPSQQPGASVGVCAKLIYGTINPSVLVEWFEYQRYMGVSKVISFTQNLSLEAMSVLEYYRKEGLGEDYPFELPMIDGSKRYVGAKNFQGWNDEQVTVYDCQGKLSGYTYIALYDVDEYLFPTLDTDFVSLLNALHTQHPKAGGFSFKTEIYASTWGADNSSDAVDDMTIGRYTLRTEPFRDRVKSIVIMDRLVPGRLSTHGYWAKPPYKKPFVDAAVAVLKHYRTCRKEWMKKDGEICYRTLQKVRDTSMFHFAAKLQQQVNEVKNKLGIK